MIEKLHEGFDLKLKKIYIDFVIALTTMALLSACGGDNNTPPSTNKVTGRFIDSAVEGLSYVCSSGLLGITNANGEYTCNIDDNVSLSVGNVFIGTVKAQSEDISPYSIFGPESIQAILLGRLLQSMDSDNNTSNGISLKQQFVEVLPSNMKFDLAYWTSNSFDSSTLDALGIRWVSIDSAKQHLKNTLGQIGHTTTLSDIESIPASERTNSENLTLASTYMNTAGVNFTDTVIIFGNQGSFQTFIKKINENSNSNDLENIEKAIASYEAVSSSISSAGPDRALSKIGISKSDFQLYLNIAYLAKATKAMGYLGDITKLGNGTDAELQASSDAIKCIYSGECSTVTITSNTGPDGFGRIVTTNAGDRLASDDGTELILTDYHDNSLIIDSKYTVSTVLTDTLNRAFNGLLNNFPDDAKQTIRNYITELDSNSDGVISEVEIAEFLEE